MQTFRQLLDEHDHDPHGRRWLFVPYDQLSAKLGPLSREPAEELGIVLIESRWKGERRPYHQQKLALLLANQRHFALEQARRGVAVRYLVTEESYGPALEQAARELGPLRVMRPAERELRVELSPLVQEELLEVLPHEGWLTTSEQFHKSQAAAPPFRMDGFYRRVRKDTGVLMEDGQPAGGKYSHDAENRKPWRGEPPAPEPPTFQPDAVTREVIELVEEHYGHHPGRVVAERLPATRRDARRLWRWAKASCLPDFGPYEDAMSQRSRSLFHTRLAPLLNLQRLTPREVLDEALELDLPLPSQEGFVRQLLGWREFVYHVHEATDGFRDLPGRSWGEWPAAGELDGGADVSFLESRAALPFAYWGKPSGLSCLDRVVEEVWDEAYTHHIPRLMVLANLATLLDVSPRELTDWFWVAFADAYDWVVEPNVLGMGTFAAGDLMTTKPYVCGAAYIDRMGDYCGSCRFDPKKDCPITALYWDFLRRKRSKLEKNPRMRIAMQAQAKRDPGRREQDAAVAHWARELLRNGGQLTPEALQSPIEG